MLIKRFQYNPILTKENVPYPGAVPEEDGSIKIYWGGADKVMCMGTSNLEDLVDHCLNNPRQAI